MARDALDKLLKEKAAAEQKMLATQRQIPPDINALELLRMIYRGEVRVDSQQLRAAIEALQFETPKISAVAVTKLTGHDFATLLDAAVARSAKVIEGRIVSEGELAQAHEPPPAEVKNPNRIRGREGPR